ncbi:protein of unknown function (plasmid) [Streptantibioticus cattleyicolor NRRL 8057 = DSM 46488]|nr:protein of unknown function [Streptantibioticus cattleyicolor NRRL 8057 = DSM 46488]
MRASVVFPSGKLVGLGNVMFLRRRPWCVVSHITPPPGIGRDLAGVKNAQVIALATGQLGRAAGRLTTRRQ